MTGERDQEGYLPVLDALAFLGPLGVVEAVQRAHQIAGDAPDALEGHPCAHHAVMHRQMALLIPLPSHPAPP